ncbi:MAG: sigma 54-interacting transcriptional regulator [Terracidiphilus sp.]|jgi:DNA-binding NtrC family response regulator
MERSFSSFPLGFGSRIAKEEAYSIQHMASIATIQNGKRQTLMIPPFEARLQRAIARIAESDSPVLILGERGAGKRSLAAQIHAQSNQSRSRFTEIRCSEAGTAALQAAISSHGTVYLYEIEYLSLPLQELVVHTHFRSGTAPPCRLLCASSRELMDEVKSWRMREEFFFHISAVTLRIPPLRCRKSEILSIADELLTQYSRQFERPKPVLCQESIEHLMEHPWPGNLSELQTAIKTFVAIGDQAISLAAIKAATASGRSNGNHKHLLLKEATRASSIQIERQLISAALAATGGNRKRAAAELGISYKALLYKLKQIEAENPSASKKNGVAR